MSARLVERALARLASGAMLLPRSDGKGFGVYPGADRRSRPIARLSTIEVRTLEAEGAIRAVGDGYAITDAGRAQARRTRALQDEAFAAQHRPVIDRTVIEASGRLTRTRGHDADACLRRLAALRDGNGAPWLSSAEVAAASRLRSDWERGECGLVRGSDWSAPPNGGAARGPGNALEGALAAHCDARRRVAEALERLAPPLRRIVELVCLREEGLEALERAEAWPARSGKIALKLALAQLAV
jgi:hypothetical protein